MSRPGAIANSRAVSTSAGLGSRPNRPLGHLIPLAYNENVQAIEVRQIDTKQILWRITTGSAQPLRSVVFGQVPDGFTQVAPQPPAGPVSLRPNDRVTVRIENWKSVLESDCEVQSDLTLSCGTHRTEGFH